MAEGNDLKTHYVFLDTQAYFENQFNWSGKTFEKLKEFARSDIIKILTTDITKKEVQASLLELVTEFGDRLRKSRVILEQLEINDPITDVPTAATCLFAKFEDFNKQARVLEIKTPTDASAILDDYFNRRPPFGTGKKKAEFPDAFVVAGLREFSKSANASIYLVSRDPDLASCCHARGPLIHLDSVAALLSLALARSELRSKFLEALKASRYLTRKISEHFANARADFLNSEIELENLSVDAVNIINANVVDRDNDTYLLEAEIEVVISGQVRRQWVDHTYRYEEFDYEPRMRVEYFGSVQYVYPEIEVTVDGTSGEIDINYVGLTTDEIELDLSDHRHLLGLSSGTIRLRVGT